MIICITESLLASYITTIKRKRKKRKRKKKKKKKKRKKRKKKKLLTYVPSRLDLFPCLSGSISTARARQFAYLILYGCCTTTLAAV